MKSRSSKRPADAVAERATGRVGPFPYHRANETIKRQRKTQAQFAEEAAKQQHAQSKRTS